MRNLRLPYLLAFAFLALVCLAPPLPARAASDAARVLASDGVPEALLPYLPRGHVDGQIRWPLPAEGDLLVLGLVGRRGDPAARSFGTAFGLLTPYEEELRGGYVIARWRDGARKIRCVLADGGVALRRGHAALNAWDDGESSRSERVQPLFEHRSLWTGPAPDADTLRTAIEAGATSLTAGLDDEAALEALRAKLRRRGIHVDAQPCIDGPANPSWILTPSRWGRPGAPVRIPTLPDLRGLTGKVPTLFVTDGPGAREILEAAWAPTPDLLHPWERHLLPYLPRTWSSVEDLLLRSAAGLRRAPLGGPWWQPKLALDLEKLAGSLPEGPVVEAPLVPRSPALDGRLDDPAWAWPKVTALPIPGGEATLLALSDGKRLVLGLRRPGGGPHLELEVLDVLGGATVKDLPPRGGKGAEEWAVGPDALAGEAYPTRDLTLILRRVDGESKQEIWRGTLLVVP